MLTINKSRPALLGLAISLGLIGCGNNSSTSFGPSVVIKPVEVDKTIAAVEWNQGNVAEKASHAYRAITKNVMIKTAFTNQLSSFDLIANLFRLTDVRSCAVSGQMTAENPSDECFLADGSTPVACDDQNAAISKNTQISRAMVCQDNGKYFDGFFNIVKTTDESVSGELRTSTTISSVGEIPKLDGNGEPVLDVNDDPEYEEITDYLFQSDDAAFFFDQAYESYVNFLTSDQDLVCGTKKYTKVDIQGIRSGEVGAFESDGTTPYYLYTRFTDLDMKSTPIESCDTDDTLKVDYSYSFKAEMESAAMGGGDDAKTKADWPDMEISLAGAPSGILTLDHENAGPVSYIVTLDFNTSGQVTVTPPLPASPTVHTLADFLAESQPATPVPAQ